MHTIGSFNYPVLYSGNKLSIVSNVNDVPKMTYFLTLFYFISFLLMKIQEHN